MNNSLLNNMLLEKTKIYNKIVMLKSKLKEYDDIFSLIDQTKDFDEVFEDELKSHFHKEYIIDYNFDNGKHELEISGSKYTIKKEDTIKLFVGKKLIKEFISVIDCIDYINDIGDIDQICIPKELDNIDY